MERMWVLVYVFDEGSPMIDGIFSSVGKGKEYMNAYLNNTDEKIEFLEEDLIWKYEDGDYIYLRPGTVDPVWKHVD